MPRRLHPDQIEFGFAAPEPAVTALAELAAEGGDGWVNLLPEVEEEMAAAVTPSPVAAIFRAPGPPIPQVTLIPPRVGRRGAKPAQLGLTHGVGARVVPRLRAEGLPLPEGWKVVQDHVRRGLVLDLSEPLDPARAVEWGLRAGVVLCPVPTTGAWLAEVHRP